MEYEWQAIDKPPDDSRTVEATLDRLEIPIELSYDSHTEKWYDEDGYAYDPIEWKDIKQP